MLDKRKFYINGQWVDPSTKNDLDVINPSDETVCAVVSLGSQADTDAAVAAARAALPSWSISTKDDRIALLERLYDIYERRMDDMAEPSQWKWGRRLISRKRLKQPLEQAPLKNSLDNLKSSNLKSSSTIQMIDSYMNQ